MQIRTFMAHGDMQALENEINAFLATAGHPVFTEVAIDERRVFVMMGFDPPAAVEPVANADPTNSTLPSDAPPPSPAPNARRGK